MIGQCLRLREKLDFRTNARAEYEGRVASKNKVLNVGGTNASSSGTKRLLRLSSNPQSQITVTDIEAEYGPDIVDDICASNIASSSFDAINCCAVLEHVQDYGAAVKNMRRILKPGGELFLYVPFFYCFHGATDYHRFTLAEVDRMMNIFSDYRLFVPDSNGFGGVLWQTLTLWQIGRAPWLWRLLSGIVNGGLAMPLALRYKMHVEKADMDPRPSLAEYRFYFTHVLVNHGFCAWAVK